MAEPSSEQWLDLHEAFREYCRAAPWQFFDDTHLVTIENPSGEDKGYCVVLGSGGMECGLAMYLGDEGLAGYLALMSGALGLGSLESLDATNALSAMLADREELSKPDRDTIRSLGLRYRGRGRWPLFQTFRPGYLPWRLEDGDIVVDTPRTAQLAQSVTGPLGIALSVGETPALWSVREELLNSLESDEPDSW